MTVFRAFKDSERTRLAGQIGKGAARQPFSSRTGYVLHLTLSQCDKNQKTAKGREELKNVIQLASEGRAPVGIKLAPNWCPTDELHSNQLVPFRATIRRPCCPQNQLWRRTSRKERRQSC